MDDIVTVQNCTCTFLQVMVSELQCNSTCHWMNNSLTITESPKSSKNYHQFLQTPNISLFVEALIKSWSTVGNLLPEELLMFSILFLLARDDLPGSNCFVYWKQSHARDRACKCTRGLDCMRYFRVDKCHSVLFNAFFCALRWSLNYCLIKLAPLNLHRCMIQAIT